MPRSSLYQSGNSVRGRNKICKMGMAQIRKVLYIAATSAIRCKGLQRAL
ncbi:MULTISPECIES: transposase [Sphingobacterium]|nr:transposase [Sphingobacterium athyrii]